MARRRNRRRGRRGLIVFGVVCLLAGGVAAWFMHGRGESFHARIPRIGTAANHPDEAAFEGMNERQLRREVRRLREQIAEKDRQIADLRIRLKLFEDGSAAGP